MNLKERVKASERLFSPATAAFLFSLCQDKQGDSRNLQLYYMVSGRSTAVYYEG